MCVPVLHWMESGHLKKLKKRNTGPGSAFFIDSSQLLKSLLSSPTSLPILCLFLVIWSWHFKAMYICLLMYYDFLTGYKPLWYFVPQMLVSLLPCRIKAFVKKAFPDPSSRLRSNSTFPGHPWSSFCFLSLSIASHALQVTELEDPRWAGYTSMGCKEA